MCMCPLRIETMLNEFSSPNPFQNQAHNRYSTSKQREPSKQGSSLAGCTETEKSEKKKMISCKMVTNHRVWIDYPIHSKLTGAISRE